MGWTSENVAEHYNISRERQDQFAFISHTRASEALKKGIFADEILPVEVKGCSVSVDDTIRPGVTAEGLATLKSAFPQWQPGTTTAGNASGVGDGAGLIMMTTRERAEREGMDILGKWVGNTVVGMLVSFFSPTETS
jgi:small subunit ribosomal protein S3e